MLEMLLVSANIIMPSRPRLNRVEIGSRIRPPHIDCSGSIIVVVSLKYAGQALSMRYCGLAIYCLFLLGIRVHN
jgi:hypothetical protein